MSKDAFTKQEIVVFAIMTLKKQLAEGYIDEEHMPSDVLDAATDADILELEAKIKQTGQIPHQNDILNCTRSFYPDDDAFTAYFAVLLERLNKDDELTSTLH
jgi:hypothetical protein